MLYAVIEPLPPSAAKALVVEILDRGEVRFSTHALQEMAADKITTDEVRAVLRGGTVEPGELERGSWRYRVSVTKADGRRIVSTCVVISFRSESATIVVTAWRKKR